MNYEPTDNDLTRLIDQYVAQWNNGAQVLVSCSSPQVNTSSNVQATRSGKQVRR